MGGSAPGPGGLCRCQCRDGCFHDWRHDARPGLEIYWRVPLRQRRLGRHASGLRARQPLLHSKQECRQPVHCSLRPERCHGLVLCHWPGQQLHPRLGHEHDCAPGSVPACPASRHARAQAHQGRWIDGDRRHPACRLPGAAHRLLWYRLGRHFLERGRHAHDYLDERGPHLCDALQGGQAGAPLQHRPPVCGSVAGRCTAAHRGRGCD